MSASAAIKIRLNPQKVFVEMKKIYDNVRRSRWRCYR